MVPKVSIVVAAYNVEKYIRRCLQSLKKQSLKEIEVLIINDGSVDDTKKICEEFDKGDTRFNLITQENGGLSEARNTGVSNATSEYIAFLDGDDYVDTTMYEKLYRKAVSNGSDLVICNFYKVWEDGQFNELKRKKISFNKHNLRVNIIKNFLAKHDEPFVVAWNKLYKLPIIKHNNLRFENRAFFEDVGFMPRYLYHCNKGVCLTDEYLCFYVQRAGSITSTYNPTIEQSQSNTINLLNNFFVESIWKEYLNAFELRLLIYKFNYLIKTDKYQSNDKLCQKKTIRNLGEYVKYIPLKHRLGYLLINSRFYTNLIKKFNNNY